MPDTTRLATYDGTIKIAAIRDQCAVHDVIAPIITEIYGSSTMAQGLIDHLAEKIANYDGPNREQTVLTTCWDWFSGGSTARLVAQLIEDALRGPDA